MFGCRYFDGTPLNPSIKYMPKYSGNNYELRICRIKMEDKGEYVVKAENSYGSREEHVFLKVERTSSVTFTQCTVSKIHLSKTCLSCYEECSHLNVEDAFNVSFILIRHAHINLYIYIYIYVYIHINLYYYY